VIEKFSGLSQWEAWHEGQEELVRNAEANAKKASEAPKTASPAASAKKAAKLGFKEQRELDGMEETIQKAEAKLAELTEQSNSPAIVSNATKLLEITQEMGKAQKEVERLYARWSELSAT
jgi:ABC transport system ATP-binding/permease protein